MKSAREDTENWLSPISKRPLYGNNISPISISILNSLSPIDRCRDSPEFSSLQPFPIFPEKSTKSLQQLSPIFQDITTFPIKPAQSLKLEKIDFASLDSKYFHVNSVPIKISVWNSQPINPTKKPKIVKRKRTTPKSCLNCTCQKSKCLKRYCDCFAAGEYCSGCSCVDCHNTAEHDLLRKEAIANTLERNPNAFKPKIKTVNKNGNNQALHNRGCNCSKSACLKKYC